MITQEDTRICRQCGEEKPLDRDHYYVWTNGPAGDWHYRCKECVKAGVTPRTPEVQKRYLDKRLMRQYGITSEQYDEMVRRQQGQCLICQDVPAKLVIDHDHETGLVRGLLCQKCNAGLGIFSDSSDVLQRAINYLRDS